MTGSAEQRLLWQRRMIERSVEAVHVRTHFVCAVTAFCDLLHHVPTPLEIRLCCDSVRADFEFRSCMFCDSIITAVVLVLASLLFLPPR